MGSSYVVEGDAIHHGATTYISCASGFNATSESPSQPEELACANGTWATRTLVCDTANCGAFPTLPAGYTVEDFETGTLHGDDRYIECATGYFVASGAQLISLFTYLISLLEVSYKL